MLSAPFYAAIGGSSPPLLSVLRKEPMRSDPRPILQGQIPIPGRRIALYSRETFLGGGTVQTGSGGFCSGFGRRLGKLTDTMPT